MNHSPEILLDLRKVLYGMLCFVALSCYPQESVLLEKTLIDWKSYPEIFKDAEQAQFIDGFEPLASIDMYEISYWSDGLKIQAFVAVPKKEGKYPAIIFNRGGNRDFGALSLFREPHHYPVAKGFPKLAMKGYVVFGCNYRGSGKSEGNDEFGGSDVNDVLNLIEVVGAFPQADTSRIGMYGWSRGGMMTYLALIRSKKIKAAVTGGAPADLTIIERPEMETKVYAELIPGYTFDKEAQLKKRSALHRVDELPMDVPILILHGTADWRVAPSNSTKLALALTAKGIPHRLKMYEGGDHGLSQFREAVDLEVAQWFEEHLK